MASLAETLYGLPTERLRALIQARNIDPKKLAHITTKRQLVQALNQELNRPNSTSTAVLNCNARELRLLQMLVSCEKNGVITWPRLLAAAGGNDLREVLKPLLDRLESLGLVFPIPDGLFLAPGVTQHIPISLSDRYELSELLVTHDLTALKTIRDRLGLTAKSDTKSAIIEAITSHLLGNGPGLKLKVPLTEDEIEVLDYVVQSGGAAPAFAIASAVLGGRADDFYRYDWPNRWKQGRERNAIDSLLARGILQVVSQNYGFNLIIVLPGDLLRVLTGEDDRAFWQEPAPVPVPLAQPPAKTVRHLTLCRDVVAFLGFLAVQEAVRTNTGHIHKTALKNAARLLSLPDERYAAFLYALCREGGLIETRAPKFVYALTSKGNAWLHWDSLVQTQFLYEAWRGGDTWAEMESEPLPKASNYRHKETLLNIRQSALDVVAEAAQEAFYEVDSLTDTLAYRVPLLLAHSAAAGVDLVASPANFMRLLVGECLFWFGLVEKSVSLEAEAKVANKKPGRGKPAPARRELFDLMTGEVEEIVLTGDAFSFRLTPSGRYFLGLPGAQTPDTEPREDKFVVQANAEIFVPPFLEPATLYHLLSLTDPPGKNATGNTVSLTRESIRRALDQGESAREMLAFLQAHSRTGIPQNVEYLVNEVGGKHGHIHVGRAQMYLQVDSPILLKELQARRELKPYFVRTLGDTVALLRGDEPEKLLRELRKAGYLPVSDDDTLPRNFKQTGKVAEPTIKPAQMPQDKQNKRAAKVDVTIDWERIAKEDDKSWAAPVSGNTSHADLPPGAVKQQSLIPFLIKQAVRSKQCVEICYQEAPYDPPMVHVIEPQRVTASVVIGLNRTSGQLQTFSLPDIQWARLTQEMFK